MKNPEKQFKEGPVATEIENKTAQIPSDIFLWTAFGFMGAALMLKLMGRRHSALFLGQWVAPMLLFGIYNKQVKQLGHDETKGSQFQQQDSREPMAAREQVV
jgi:hypothetical protein